MATATARAETRLAPLDAAIEQRAGALREIHVGLRLLRAAAPIFPGMGPEVWRLVLAYITDFARDWDGLARAAGWSSLQLYGLHPIAPAARLSVMGAAWVAARSAHKVIAIEAAAIVVATQTGGRLRIYRTAPDPEAVLPWPV
jgi:hypothetical protein